MLPDRENFCQIGFVWESKRSTENSTDYCEPIIDSW